MSKPSRNEPKLVIAPTEDRLFALWFYTHWLTPHHDWAPSSSGTENSAKAFSFLNTRSDFLTVTAVAVLLATPSAALGDSVSSASVAALPTRGDDVLEDHGGSILCPRAGHSAPG